MIKIENSELQAKCNQILQTAPIHLTNDYKMRYLYHELGMVLAKNVEFFYGQDEEQQREIYNNYQLLDSFEVVCSHVAYLYVEMGKELGLDCSMIESSQDKEVPFTHWAIQYNNGSKKYLLNPIPDFYRIQMGFSTKHFCYSENYVGLNQITFDNMSLNYIRELDKTLGYLVGNMYTEELFEKLSGELTNKIGSHIVRTSDYYQEYYLKMLEMIQNKNISLEEKILQIKFIDPDFSKHEKIVRNSLEQNQISKEFKKTLHDIAFKKLIDTPVELQKEREGSKYLASVDVSRLRDLKKEMLIYKFHYMMLCIPQVTTNLTGYIENKCFTDELKKYLFRGADERSAVYRYTVTSYNENTIKYYMMFSLKIEEDESLYCFYNPETKEVNMNIEPVQFMSEKKLKPLPNSSLNQKIKKQLEDASAAINIVPDDIKMK